MPATAKGEQPHIIVFGDEIGGSGKTTLAMHLIVGLLNRGLTVASIDLNTQPKGLTEYLSNRSAWANSTGRELSFPSHHQVNKGILNGGPKDEDIRYRKLAKLVMEIEADKDFIVIDTSGTDCFLSHFAIQMADTLVTPVNGSFDDREHLGHSDVVSGTVERFYKIASSIREARCRRRGMPERNLDWLVIRNRMYQFRYRNTDRVLGNLEELSEDLGCRFADGLSERQLFRGLFEQGLTVLDYSVPKITNATLLHTTARHEVRSLINKLKLPNFKTMRGRPRSSKYVRALRALAESEIRVRRH